MFFSATLKSAVRVQLRVGLVLPGMWKMRVLSQHRLRETTCKHRHTGWVKREEE
jgi:hypothetical protein